MMKKPVFCIIGALACLLAACSAGVGKEQEGRTIAVSIEPLRALLEPLARGRFEVVGVMDRGADPENFEPSISRRMAVDASEAFFIAGGLPFERTLAAEAPPSVAVIDLSEGIEPIYGTHDHCGHGAHHHDHDHGMPDPHTWSSVRNARIMAASMAAALTSLDPDGADIYATRLDALSARLDSLDQAIATTLAGADSTFMVWHPSLSYFARDYGLRQIALGAEGKDFSAAGMRRAIDAATEAGAGIFLLQRGIDPRQAAGVCRDAGATPVAIDALGYDCLQQLTIIAHELARN